MSELAGTNGENENLQILHHEGYDPAIKSPYVPAIRVAASSNLIFLSGVTAAPVYHDHPHVEEVFASVPADMEGQIPLLFENLDAALRSAGSRREDIVNLVRFFTNVGEDQDIVNRYQGQWFGSHVPTSTSVEVTRLATDPRLRIEIQAIAISSR